jgi:DNA-directed RNA polymerase subunit L
MKLNIVQDDQKELIIEFDSSIDRGIPELIKSKLLYDKSVSFAGVVKEHPERGNTRLIIKSSKNAKSLVLKAVEELEDEFKELSSGIK